MIERKVLIYFHTLKYLRFTQIKYRIFYFFRNKLRSKFNISFKNRDLNWRYPLLKLEKSLPAATSVEYSRNQFSFLNLHRKFKNGIDWNDKSYGKLWLYNLNYFEFLHIPNITSEEGLRLIRDFILKTDSLKDGLEPFPISLRAIHWIKFLTYNRVHDKEIDQSLYNQLWILVNNREYHLLGNHLLENGFGLLFGAYYFNDERLYKKAKGIIKKELKEQVLSDGAHFELSPMYHQLMLYRVLDCYNLLKNNLHFDKELLVLLGEKSRIMLGWLKKMTFQNGDIPLLNDSAFGVAPSTSQIMSYGSRLGLSPTTQDLKDCGYRKYETPRYELVLDVGKIAPDYMPGHAHSDTLSFVLYVDRKPIIVDTGISTYEKNAKRQLERSTRSHNTVRVDGKDQSEVWGGFRVARRAYPNLLKDSNGIIVASHTGYQKIGARHTRTFEWDFNKIVINDEVKYKAGGKSEAFLHFHPNVNVQREGERIIIGKTEIVVKGAVNMELREYLYAPEFNQRVPATKAVFEFADNVKTTIFI